MQHTASNHPGDLLSIFSKVSSPGAVTSALHPPLNALLEGPKLSLVLSRPSISAFELVRSQFRRAQAPGLTNLGFRGNHALISGGPAVYVLFSFFLSFAAAYAGEEHDRAA